MKGVTRERDISNNRGNEVTTCSSSWASRSVISLTFSSCSDTVKTLEEENSNVFIYLSWGQIGERKVELKISVSQLMESLGTSTPGTTGDDVDKSKIHKWLISIRTKLEADVPLKITKQNKFAVFNQGREKEASGRIPV